MIENDALLGVVLAVHYLSSLLTETESFTIANSLSGIYPVAGLRLRILFAVDLAASHEVGIRPGRPILTTILLNTDVVWNKNSRWT